MMKYSCRNAIIVIIGIYSCLIDILTRFSVINKIFQRTVYIKSPNYRVIDGEEQVTAQVDKVINHYCIRNFEYFNNQLTIISKFLAD